MCINSCAPVDGYDGKESESRESEPTPYSRPTSSDEYTSSIKPDSTTTHRVDDSLRAMTPMLRRHGGALIIVFVAIGMPESLPPYRDTQSPTDSALVHAYSRTVENELGSRTMLAMRARQFLP